MDDLSYVKLFTCFESQETDWEGEEEQEVKELKQEHLMFKCVLDTWTV